MNVIVFQGSKGNATDHSDPPRSAPPEPHHAGGNSSFVKKHQSGRVKQALLSNPTSARASHICSLSLGSLQAFLNLDLVPVKKARQRAAAGRMDAFGALQQFLPGSGPADA
jgi:hypothetical protein